MGDREGHRAWGQHDRSARGRTKRKSFARGRGEAVGTLEKDPPRSIAAISARPRAGVTRISKPRNCLRFLRYGFRVILSHGTTPSALRKIPHCQLATKAILGY